MSSLSFLPRGPSQKRKPPDMTVLIVFLFLTPLVAAFTEPLIDLTTALPPSTAMGLPNDGICRDIFIRYDKEKIQALKGCRVVEGSVAIMLMDELKSHEIEDESFPELVEITGFLMLYRISGLKTLSRLFPNLAVIRGRDLFKDYALIIYEMIELTDIGLKSLAVIERGNVRIEKNEMLCFVDTVNWKQITAENYDPYREKNKLSYACPNCPADKCSRSAKENFCWSKENCQRICRCGEGVACSPNGSCCSKDCLGGCEDGEPDKCVACKKFTIGVHPNISCINECPNGTYLYHNRRCLTAKECYDLNTHLATDNSVNNPEGYFFPYLDRCFSECPQGYSKKGKGNSTTCEKCKDKCQKRCPSRIIDSISSAQKLKGCSVITGHLEIQIRGSTKNLDTSNIVKELEENLIDIEEIEEYLKIARSHPIVSLSFLKNLKRIRGRKLESNRNALIVWENQNLANLWDENQTIAIEGKLFFHFNPKLCFHLIQNFAEKVVKGTNKTVDTIIENYETAKLSNGDKTPCNVTTLEVHVASVFPHAALLTWNPLELDDDRALLNYVVYYIAAPHQNVTLWDGRNACGNDDWNVEDVTITNEQKTLINQPITKLEPYTQYAFYVKAFTLVTEQRGAQSNIKYFKTAATMPNKMKAPQLVALGPDKIKVTWETPQKVNGEIDHYILRAKSPDQDSFTSRDYCADPISAQHSLHPKEPQQQTPKEAPKLPEMIAPNGYCDCKSCSKQCSGDTNKLQEDEEDRRGEIEFEDAIQDFVYIQQSDGVSDEMPKEELSRAKRQAEFPYDTTKPASSASDKDSLRNSSDYYNDQISKNETSFIITNLTHFRNYQISIKVCRKPESDTEEKPEESHLCSHEASEYIRTEMEPSMDLINETDFKVEKIQNNSSSSSEIRVSWTKPENPNGLLLSYQIRYKKLDGDTSSQSYGQIVCVPADKTHYIFPKLPEGNYSFEVRANTLAQDGNFTKPKTYYIQEPSSSGMLVIVICLVIFFIISIVAFVLVVRRMYSANISSMKLIANVNPDYAGVTYKQDEWEIPREKIIRLHELGQGSFGMVYEGIVKDLGRPGEEMRCAIKTVNESATDKERISFLNEASVMKQFDTFHVVRLLGVVSQGQPTFVVMELMANGDLKGYLRSHRPEYDTGSESPKPPTLRQTLQMAIEIADGMSYLAAKKFVHRDLAARNCMVAEDLTVKIGDFGMTRDIYETDYYRKGTKGLLPVRWMSPESLKDGVFTSSSDVFSFGVVLWEMATLASQPYQGLSNDQVLRYVIEGGVMERPENCPDKLYELMRRCWQHRPSARPTFLEIITMLLEDSNPKFQKVSFYHSVQGQEILHQSMQGELVQITDDVTTPLRQEEEETSSVEAGNNFLMGEYRNGSVGDL